MTPRLIPTMLVMLAIAAPLVSAGSTVVTAGDHYVVVTDTAGGSGVFCPDVSHPCAGPWRTASAHVAIWQETNGIPGLQQQPTPDGPADTYVAGAGECVEVLPSNGPCATSWVSLQ